MLLHGWPGDHTDYDDVLAALGDSHDVVVPDLRGFGVSDKHPADPAEQYSVDAQARSVVGLLEELGIGPAVIGGYDIGSRIGQKVAQVRPDLVRALVVTPPLPGVGTRVLAAEVQPEVWYQAFHRLDLATALIDSRHHAVRVYLEHFWTTWSGPSFVPAADRLDHLTSVYSGPGAFTASINWYRAGSGMVARALAETLPDPADRMGVPTTVLWPEHDPLFTRAWSDRLEEFFARVTLRFVDGVGHFVPVEAPHEFAGTVVAAAGAPRG
jgi:pimeloyl-ACP methyl ester carboxylesterase